MKKREERNEQEKDGKKKKERETFLEGGKMKQFVKKYEKRKKK